MRLSLLMMMWCLGCGIFEIFLSELGWNTPWRCDLLLATVVLSARFVPFSVGCVTLLCVGLLKDGWSAMPVGFYILHTQGIWIWSRVIGQTLTIWIVGFMSGFLWLILSWMISSFLLVQDHPITFSLSIWISYPLQCSFTCGCLSFLFLFVFKDELYQDRSLPLL